jgi:hypothetical protein
MHLSVWFLPGSFDTFTFPARSGVASKPYETTDICPAVAEWLDETSDTPTTYATVAGWFLDLYRERLYFVGNVPLLVCAWAQRKTLATRT